MCENVMDDILSACVCAGARRGWQLEELERETETVVAFISMKFV